MSDARCFSFISHCILNLFFRCALEVKALAACNASKVCDSVVVCDRSQHHPSISFPSIFNNCFCRSIHPYSSGCCHREGSHNDQQHSVPPPPVCLITISLVACACLRFVRSSDSRCVVLLLYWQAVERRPVASVHAHF
jgi:hypothetical protein